MDPGTTLPPVRGNTAFLSTPAGDRISLASLAALYLTGVRRLVVAPVPGGAPPIGERITRLNGLLHSRGLRPVVLKQAGPDELAAWHREIARETAENAGRRGFLTRLAQPVADVVDDNTPEADPLAELQALEAARSGALFAFVPVIEPSRCTGCDACVNVCPKDALILLKDNPNDPSYDSRAQECDGCGLCIDICGSDAMQVAEMAEQPRGLMLEAFKCRDCGVEVHEPLGHVLADGLCRICRETGHKKKLFQVLS